MRIPSVFALFLISAKLSPGTVTADGLTLVLLHTNDMHSKFDEIDENGNDCGEDDAASGLCFGGFARVAEVVREEKEKAKNKGLPSLFVVSGDTFQGTPYYLYFKWKTCVEFIKELKPDVMTLGNHEFDNGVRNLVSYLTGINETTHTVVSNLDLTAEPELNNLVSTSHVFTINDTKVGVVGYLTTDTPTISNTESVVFYDEIKCLKIETKNLRENGVNIIIALGHSEFSIDQQIAKEVEDIDLIIGGHSHTFLYSGKQPSTEIPSGPYPFFVTNAKNKKIPILQAYANTKYVGKVEVKFDSNGDLINISGSPILLDHTINKDPSMLTLLNQWKPLLTNITKVAVGHTVVELSSDCYYNECNMGNLITDSFVYFNVVKSVSFTDQFWTDAPIAIIQAGCIRSSITKVEHGNITMGNLINVSPFGNKLVKITVSGQTLLDAFEYSVYNYSHDLRGVKFLQVSGIRVVYDLSQKPNKRVVSLKARCSNCVIPIFEPVVPSTKYTIMTVNFLANGGDNYTMFKNATITTHLTDAYDYDAIGLYVKAISPVMTGIEDRIIIKT